MDDADGDLHPGGDGADGFPALAAVEDRGAFVVVDESEEIIEIRPEPDRMPGLLFVPVAEGKTSKNRLHPDFRPDDQEAEVAWLLSLGARRVDTVQDEQHWVTLLDPEGNEFCFLGERKSERRPTVIRGPESYGGARACSTLQQVRALKIHPWPEFPLSRLDPGRAGRRNGRTSPLLSRSGSRQACTQRMTQQKQRHQSNTTVTNRDYRHTT
ncbi:VOC family protein [Nonomuraea jabiensis]|uniref:Glyoxalase-like domain-containing protein n=1 Tax=Nonomuraea jabiensis TaxID=882448 RepID=A0A7W9LFK4_9ACTN|nr:VOC family protein [Nonomuraea jabiensis]MBB5782007.1 hypothetical protein [Nonomuraea jabiensis]